MRKEDMLTSVQGCFQRRWGLCWYIHILYEKPPTLAALAMAADKCQEWRHSATRFSRFRHLRDCSGAWEKFVFKVKKLSNDIKDIKTVMSNDQN